MDRLIDELTFYSKIDTTKIPYTFSKINVARYFKDCVEEVGLDMEARGIELGYFNYVDDDIVVIADAEQDVYKRQVYTDERGQIVFLDTPGIHKDVYKRQGLFRPSDVPGHAPGLPHYHH